MAERTFTPPTEYPFGVNFSTLTDKHLDVLINGYMRRNARGPALSDRERTCLQRLLGEKDTRRMAAANKLTRRLEEAG